MGIMVIETKMKKVVLGILLLQVAFLCGATRLPSCWCDKIVQLCEGFDDDKSSLPMVDSSCYLQYVYDTSCDPVAFLFPPIIIWSPLEQFKDLLQDIQVCCPKCTEHVNAQLCPTGWRSGVQGSRSEPRKLYGADGITLLITRIYKCARGHEVVGYHPGILKHIPQCLIPFLLWHKTGFTCELIKLVSALITAGMNISGIRDFYHRKQLSMYYSRKAQFDHISTSGSPFPPIKVWKESFPNFLPSIHALSGCFLVEFWSKEEAYTLHMQTMTIDNDSWLSLDHTFSSASKL